MSTNLQLAANRQNSQHSTGPRSVSGKLTSSQNALKTGIYSEAEIIRGETRADLDALAADYHNQFQPDGPAERCFVDILVHSDWMLRRFRRAEAQLWELNADADVGKRDNDDLDLAYAIDIDDSRIFARLQRRIDSTQRNFHRALKELKQLQSTRPPIQESEPASEPVPQPTIGFVPSPQSDPATQSAQCTAPAPILTPYSLLLTPPPSPVSFLPAIL